MKPPNSTVPQLDLHRTQRSPLEVNQLMKNLWQNSNGSWEIKVLIQFGIGKCREKGEERVFRERNIQKWSEISDSRTNITWSARAWKASCERQIHFPSTFADRSNFWNQTFSARAHKRPLERTSNFECILHSKWQNMKEGSNPGSLQPSPP